MSNHLLLITFSMLQKSSPHFYAPLGFILMTVSRFLQGTSNVIIMSSTMAENLYQIHKPFRKPRRGDRMTKQLGWLVTCSGMEVTDFIFIKCNLSRMLDTDDTAITDKHVTYMLNVVNTATSYGVIKMRTVSLLKTKWVQTINTFSWKAYDTDEQSQCLH